MSTLGVTIYGVCALSFMMAMYALERRSRRFILFFAVGCLLSSAYGFLSGAWRSEWSSSSGQGSPCDVGEKPASKRPTQTNQMPNSRSRVVLVRGTERRSAEHLAKATTLSPQPQGVSAPYRQGEPGAY